MGEFTVVAWDMPGCGRSSDPPEQFRTRDDAECLAAFIEGLGLEHRTVRSSLSVAQDMHARSPGSRLVVLPGAGYLIDMEAPERFKAQVRRFFRSEQR